MTAFQDPSVADAASIAPSAWAAASTPHVFRGFGGYLGGRNRGRLPFIEFDIQTQPFAQETPEGGTVTTAVRVVAHVGGRDLEAANDVLDNMLIAGLACLRSEAEDNYMAIGSEEVGQIEQGPWGHQMALTLSVEHSYGRDTYERD
jgi:hypothetical protein